MIDGGIEPSNFLNDLLEVIYFIQQKKSLGTFDSDLQISEAEIEIINSISKTVKMSTLIIFWQFILKGLEELTIVTNQILSIEMLVIRLIHLKDMPNYESLLRTLNESNSSPIKDNIINNQNKKVFINEENATRKITKDQIKNLVQTKPKDLPKDTSMKNISSFENLIKLASEKREGELKYDLERNVNLVKFSEGKIDISFNEKLGKNFVRNLSEKLNEWTGKRWLITLTKQAGNKTYREMQTIKQNDFLENEKKSETYKKLKNIFPDAELLEVSKKE